MKTFAAAACSLVCCASSLAAQPPDLPEPQKEHRWLAQFVGQWQGQSRGTAGPDQPEMVCQSTMSSRMLGGFWVVSELKNDVMGVEVRAVQTIGYDPGSKKFVGTWVDSMSDHLWKYVGSLDDSGKILTLEAEGPSFTEPGKTGRYRDIYEFKDKDHIAASSLVQDGDGKWVTMMTGDLRRKP